MTIRMITLVALAPLLLLTGAAEDASAQPTPVCVATSGLNGLWSGDGGYFYVREIGTEVWWVGFDAVNNGRTWTTVFRGTRSGDIVTGNLADVRGSKAGTMSLQVQGTWRMDKIATNIPMYTGVASIWIHRC